MLLNDCKNMINRTIRNDLICSKLSELFNYFDNNEEVIADKNNDVYKIVQNNKKLTIDTNSKGIRAIIDCNQRERIIKELIIFKDEENTIVLLNSSISRPDGEYIENKVSAKKITYNEDDIAVLSEYKKYLTGSLEGNPDIDELLEVPRMAFDLGFWQDKYALYKRIERKYYDVALLTINGNHKRIYNGIVPLNNDNYQELVIDTFIYKKLDSIEIDPWDRDEMHALLNRYEGKVGYGLTKFAEGRLEFSYRSKKDEDYYYDKDSGIDFIKE
jgi:hypothetical protein